MVAIISPGGEYEGLRIAKQDEIDSLFSSAGLSIGYSTDEDDMENALALFDLTGANYHTHSLWPGLQLHAVIGMYDPGYPIGPDKPIGLLDFHVWSIDPDTWVEGQEGSVSVSVAFSDFGRWYNWTADSRDNLVSTMLVRDTTIPEPSTLALLGIGLLGLIGYG